MNQKDSSSPSRALACVLAALAALTLVAYAGVAHSDFVSIDDPTYVTENPMVARGLSWAGLKWAFTTGHAANWHPLTWLSHMLDAQLFGMSAGAHHAVNLALHIFSTLLLFLVLYWMTRRLGASAFVAALFAVHPLHVESVAWVAERKDVLSTAFLMLTLIAYVHYVRTPGTAHSAPRTAHGLWYLLVLLFFALGLMAKPMLVTLPVVLLLLDVWPLGGVGRGFPAGNLWPLLREKLPLFALAIISSAITFFVQHRGGAVSNLAVVPLSQRLANALVAYATYAFKMVWPTSLSVFYRYPDTIPVGTVIISTVFLVLVSVVAVRARHTRPYLAVGWLWYLVTLAPVIGIVQIGRQSMADRYTYVPLIGLFVMVAWGVSDLVGRRSSPGRPRPEGRRTYTFATLALLIVMACTVATRAQVAHWANSEALWSHALALDPQNYFAHNSVGTMSADKGDLRAAAASFEQAIRIAPDYPEAYNNLGLVYARQGRPDAAIVQYRKALALNPDLPEAHHGLGVALAMGGRTAEAIGEYEAAITLNPDRALFRDNLGKALVAAGRITEAVAQFEQALRLDPRLASAHSNLGMALARQGKVDEAIERYTEALRLNPALVDAHNNLGVALSAKGDTEQAVAHYREALRLQPGQADVHSNLGVALAAAGRRDEAIAECSKAITLNARVAAYHYNLGFVLAGQGRAADAVAPFGEALRLQPDLAPAHTSLALALTSLGRLGDAIPHFADAARLQPGSDTAHQYLGLALAGAGRFDEAIRELNEALRINPGNQAARTAVEKARAVKAKG